MQNRPRFISVDKIHKLVTFQLIIMSIKKDKIDIIICQEHYLDLLIYIIPQFQDDFPMIQIAQYDGCSQLKTKQA